MAMLKSKPSFLMLFVGVLLTVGAVVYLVIRPADVVVTPPVERLSEIEVNIPDDKRAKYEAQVIEYTAEITTKEAAGTYALDSYFLRGIVYQRLGKLALAYSDLQIVVAGDPGNETAWNNLGDIVMDMGDVMAAEEYYKNAIAQDPSEVAYNKLYRYYTEYRKADRDSVIPELLKQALVDNPNAASFYVKLGRWYVEHGDKDKALSAYRQAAVLSPDSEAIKQELNAVMAL